MTNCVKMVAVYVIFGKICGKYGECGGWWYKFVKWWENGCFFADEFVIKYDLDWTKRILCVLMVDLPIFVCQE